MNWATTWQAVGPLVGVVIGGAITYILQSRLQKRQHAQWIKQQWWGRKADIYSKLIQFLSMRYNDAIRYEESMYSNGPVRWNPDEDRSKQMRSDAQEIRDLASVGAFVITEEIAEALKEYLRDFDGIVDIIDVSDQIEADINSSERCLKRVREEALRDLELFGEKNRVFGRVQRSYS